MTVAKTQKETFNVPLDQPAAGADSTVANSLQTQAQDLSIKDPIGTKNIAAGNEVGAPSNVVKVNIDGKEVNAVQTMGTDGKPVLTYNNVEYSLESSKAGTQVWKSDDGQTITQNRGRVADTPNLTTPTDVPPSYTPPAATPTDTPTNTPTSGTPDSSAGKTPIGDSTTGDVKNPTPDSGGAKDVPPISTTPVSDAKTPPAAEQPSIPEAGKGGKGGSDEPSRDKGGNEKGNDRGNDKGGESGSGGSSGGSERGSDRGVEKGADKDGEKISIPEKPAEKPRAESPPERSEKPPSEKLDLTKPEARRELFEALKSARDILDGKADLKSVDPKQRALVEELMKLDQSRSDKLFNLLSQEFKGPGSGRSDAAAAFNLRTLLGLEKITSPVQPTPPIPGLSPELAAGLYKLFQMYNSDANAQRSTMLAEAFKFSSDYNAKLGLDSKNGLTSRDVLVALNTMSKDFNDLLAKQQSPMSSLLASKETLAQLAPKDAKEMTAATELTARMKELTAAQLADEKLTGIKLPDAALKPGAQDGLAIGKVEGQVKDMGAKADALNQQHAADQASSNAKTQQGQQLGQKDPLTAEQKELAEREGPKKKQEPADDREEAARRMAAEAAIAAMGGRASSAEITEGTDDNDADKKKQDEKEARRQYKCKQGDTLEMIAETQLKSKTAATLIYNLNSNNIPTKVMGTLHIISLRPDMDLVLPTPNEVKTFKGPYLSFQYREFGSAEEELAFWQKFISGQAPGHSSLFDKFGVGQNQNPLAGGGVDDTFAAEAFTASQRQNIRTQLGMDKEKETKEVASAQAKTVRYGESIRKFTARTLFDESLWELVAQKNNLPIVEDNKGEKNARLKSYQKLVLPTPAEVKQYKQSQGIGTTLPLMEIVSQECPKCRRLVRQNETVCPPPCFYAFIEATAEPAVEIKPEDPQARLLRRRRTTGFIPAKETAPVEVPNKPFENDVINTVLKAAGLSSAGTVEVTPKSVKAPLPASGEAVSNPSRRGVKVQDFDPACRVVLTPKDREGRKFERKLEVLKDGNWVVAVVYEIGAQESFVTEFATDGSPRKQRIDLPFEPAMELSENHLNEAWKEYRQQFLGE